MNIQMRLSGFAGFLAGMIITFGGASPAAAQWGMGMGWGMFGVGPSPSTQLLNQHALTRAGAGGPRGPSRNVYSGNSNSYLSRVRDNGFVSHYDVARRAAPSYGLAPPVPGSSTGRAGNRSAARSSVTLASFFDASLALVWPSESPVSGELRSKRDISDEASRAVLKETRQHGAASLASVTDARQKLIDYGKPALQEIRARSTTAIADAFHNFMLSLYDSLAAAAPSLGGAAGSGR
jgi:hypothetical protein